MSNTSKNIFVEISATETAVSRRLLVLKVPLNCTAEDITEIDADLLNQLATESGSEFVWEHDGYEGDSEIRSGIDVGEETDMLPDVDLVFDTNGNLIATQCQ